MGIVCAEPLKFNYSNPKSFVRISKILRRQLPPKLQTTSVSLSSPTQTPQLKRALAVQMFLNGYKHQDSGEPRYKFRVHQQMDSNVWTVGCSWIKTGIPWVGRLSGATATGCHHLAPDQNYWNLAELQGYVQQEYDVVFDSKQSYYLKKLGLAGKKHRNNPKRPRTGQKKKRLEAHRAQIVSGQLVVFFVDECHLLWGDLCGYVWGKTDERIEVPIINERSKQTYYGAVNLSTQQCLIQAYKTGNSESTIAFLNIS